jgi:benzoyl-CoA-dihydrodiol lyase
MIAYPHVRIEIEIRGHRHHHCMCAVKPVPVSLRGMRSAASPLAVARELEDAIMHLRFNEPAIGLLIFRTEGEAQAVLDHDAFLARNQNDWLMREVRHYVKRALKRIDVTARSFVSLVEPGTCFAGTLAELLFASDRSLMLIGRCEGDNRPPAAVILGKPFGLILWATGRASDRFMEPKSVRAHKVGAVIEGKEAVELARHLRL